MTSMRSVLTSLVPLLLTMGSTGCDEVPVPIPAEIPAWVAEHDLRALSARHARAWDLTMAGNRPDAEVILQTIVADDATFSIDLPGEADDVTFPGTGATAWLDMVEQLSAAAGWVGAHHLIGSVVVDDGGDETAQIRSYVRASHYLPDGTSQVGEADWVYEVVQGDEGWTIVSFTSVVKALRDEGGLPVPPVPATP